MKKRILLLCLLGISFAACKDKKAQKSTENTELKATIEKVEQENKELKSMEDEIKKDINEIDNLLKEVDEIK